MIGVFFIMEQQVRKLIDTYVTEIRTLRKKIGNRKSCRIRTALRCGIPPNRALPTHYISTGGADPKEIKYWRSISTRSAMEEKLQKYLDYIPSYCTNATADVARRMVRDALRGCLQNKRCSPLSYRYAFRAVPQDTSPGFPWNRVGIKQKRDCSPVFHRLRYIEKQLYNKQFEFSPCVAQARRPLCKVGENKPRLVWAYPMEMTMIEATYAVPLIELMSKVPYFAWSYNWLAGYAQYHWDHMCKGRGIKCGADWKSFDSEISAFDINWAFDVLQDFVLFKDRKSLMRWSRMVDYFINTPILFYDSLVLVKGGIPSGSFFTQLVGTVLNMYYSTYLFLRLSQERCYVDYSLGTFDELFNFAVYLGDDFSVAVDFAGYTHDRDRLAVIAKEELNKTLHPQKGFFYNCYPVDGECEGYEFDFLGKSIPNRHEVFVEPALVLAQIVYPEDKDTDPGDVLTRIIGVLWMAGTDRRCDEVCRMAWEHIKGKYPLAEPTPFKKDLRDVFKFMLFIKKPSLTLPDRYTLLNRYVCQ